MDPSHSMGDDADALAEAPNEFRAPGKSTSNAASSFSRRDQEGKRRRLDPSTIHNELGAFQARKEEVFKCATDFLNQMQDEFQQVCELEYRLLVLEKERWWKQLQEEYQQRITEQRVKGDQIFQELSGILVEWEDKENIIHSEMRRLERLLRGEFDEDDQTLQGAEENHQEDDPSDNVPEQSYSD